MDEKFNRMCSLIGHSSTYLRTCCSSLHFAFRHTLYVVLFALFGMTLVVNPAWAKPAKEHIWVRIHVDGAGVWPVNAKGNCWDPCNFGKRALPKRQIQPYKEYTRDVGFKSMMTGWKAPDVKVYLNFGKQRIETPVVSNTTEPKWSFSKIISIAPHEGWTIRVVDVDSWGEQTIGRYTHRLLPPAFHRSGVFTLRKVGQIEYLRIRVERLARQYVRSPRTAKHTKNPPSSLTKKHKHTVRTKKPIHRQSLSTKTPKKSSVSARIKSTSLRKAPLHRPRTAPPLVRTLPRIVRKKSVQPLKRAKNPAGRVLTQTKKKTKHIERPKWSFFRITIHKANIWPVRSSSHCWDMCFTRSSKLPPRGLETFDSYFIHPLFKDLSKGYHAPDPWIELKIGSSTWKTRVVGNTLKPKWSQSFIVRGRTSESVSIRVLDKDSWGSEVIGHWKHQGLPKAWKKGGRFILRQVDQVERLEMQVEPLRRVEPPRNHLRSVRNVPPHVRFVKITVVKAKIWPLTSKRKCWDTCTSWKVPLLPPRGLSQKGVYEKDPGFRMLSQGRTAPDPRVKIKLGAYDMYITPTKTNTVEPKWNASHIFRLRGNQPMTVTVSDDDQNVAHDVLRTYRSTRELMDRWSEEVIGTYTIKNLPIQMVEGGRLILRSFGQVEYLELKVEPLPYKPSNSDCEGVYRVRVAELQINALRADGRAWHPGVGRMSLPSAYTKIWLGSQKLETPVAYKRLKAIYQTSRIIPIRKHMTMSIEVRDFTVGFRLSFDKQVKVPLLPIRVGIGMKNEPSSQSIGQTAFLSVCDLIKRSKNGVVQLKPFGQVKKVLLFFDKISS